MSSKLTNKEKNENFKLAFKKLYPNYEIIEFNGLGKPVTVVDENGFLHRKSKASRFLTHCVGIQSVVDKKQYIQFLLDSICSQLTVLDYNGIKEKITVEDVNGFIYKPCAFDLLKGSVVSIETCTEKENLFIFKANIKHKNKYVYPSFEYKKGKQHIDIICPFHGKFVQTIESHLQGRGCKKCSSTGFSEESWVKRLGNKEATFYILNMSNDKESFIKIGITSTSIETRYKTLNNYNYEIIDIIKGLPENIYKIEKRALKFFKDDKYIPNAHFQGYTECFTNKILENYEQFKKEISESY